MPQFPRSRVPLLIAVLYAALLCTPAISAEPARVTARTPLADYARHAEGTEFYGAYLLGSKVGWVTDVSRMAAHQGKPVFERAFEMRLAIGKAGSSSTMSMQSAARYSLEGDGQIISMTETETEGKTTLQRTAVRDGNRLRITTRENGQSTERVASLPRDTLKQQRDLEAWLAAGPKKGARFTVHEASLSEADIESESTYEFIEPVQLVWGGVPVMASKVTMDIDGARFTALVNSQGKLLNGKIGGLFEFRAEEEAVAKARNGTPVDMIAASQIRIDAPLGDNDSIRALTLEFSGLGDFKLPVSARQHVQPLGNGRARVELSREAQVPAATPLTQKDRQDFLRTTPSVQSDHADIRALAARIVGDTKDPVQAATLIGSWVYDNLRATHGADASTATAVLAQRAGDCTEHALLFTALARAAGIPTRQVGGIMYTDRPLPVFSWHAWAEIHDGRGWISVDPTWEQVRVDPTHVQFSLGGEDIGEDMAWVSVVGQLEIKVGAVQTGR